MDYHSEKRLSAALDRCDAIAGCVIESKFSALSSASVFQVDAIVPGYMVGIV